MPLPCHCMDITRFDFRGDYNTDKQLKRTIDSLVDETLIAAAAEDVTEKILHEALVKAKGGSYIRRFTMTSKKAPETNSDDEAVADVETDAVLVPQGDTPLSPEVIKMVANGDEENPATCGEKESLEEEIKKMISKISAFEFEMPPGKNVTEGQGDAEGVEVVPADKGEIYESQAAPDLLVEKSSSEEWAHQESKEDIAAWEEAVEVEVQIIDPAYDDGDTPVYYKESISPSTSNTESFSEATAEARDVESNELQHQMHVDSFSTKTESDELELETLAFCTSMVVDIMSRVEENIIAIEINAHDIEANVENTVNISQIDETNKHDEMIEATLSDRQPLSELEKAHITTPIISTIKPSMPEPIYGQTTKDESEEEDLYDIDSINVHFEDILNLNAQVVSAIFVSQTNSQNVPSSDHGLETMTHPNSNEHMESLTTPTSSNCKMGIKVQSCDDIFARAAAQSDSIGSFDNNTFGRIEVPHTVSVRSLDSFSEVHYKNTESEEIKYQSGQREKLPSSINILQHKDSGGDGLVFHNEIIEDKLPTSTGSDADEWKETENSIEAVEQLEKKEIKIDDINTLEEKDSVDLLCSINTYIKNRLEQTEIAKVEELTYTRTQSSQNLLQTTSQSIQEDKQNCEVSEIYLETRFRSSPTHNSIRPSPRETSNKPHCISERKIKTNTLLKSSSSPDERDAMKMNDMDCNVYSEEKVNGSETPNGKVGKGWKFGTKVKNFISAIRRKF